MHSRRTSHRRATTLLQVLIAAVLVATGARGVAAAESQTDLNEWTLANPALPDGVVPLGQGRLAEHQSVSYLLYAARHTHVPWVLVRDVTTGESTHVELPPGTTGGTAWARADLAVTDQDLWVLAGAGPVYLRHYRLTGTPLATGASLLEERVLGDSDSRAGALTALADGGVAGVWHQQGATSPQGLHFVHASPTGALSQAYVDGVSTRSSTQAISQHPADGSVWAFSSADAGGTITGVRLVATSAGLGVDDIEAELISRALHGAMGPDPEAPDLEVAPDPATGTIAIAYQSSERRIFSTDPFVAGSHVAIARMGADASLSFLTLPVYVERISAIGLIVRGSETWLAHRPVGSDLRFDGLHLSRHDGTSWTSTELLGQLDDPRATVYFGRHDATVAAPMSDNQVHAYSNGPAPSWTTGGGDSSGDDGGTTSDETPTTKKGGGGKGTPGRGGGPKK